MSIIHGLRVFVVASGVLVLAGAPATRAAAQDVNPDNSKVNKRDRKASEPTADRQNLNSSDREIIRSIRKAIVSDKSLSTYAKNIKIVSDQGSVTLKGPVRSEDEKKAVLAKAEAVTGVGKVNDELSVTP